jgi:hypothetical protein
VPWTGGLPLVRIVPDSFLGVTSSGSMLTTDCPCTPTTDPHGFCRPCHQGIINTDRPGAPCEREELPSEPCHDR